MPQQWPEILRWVAAGEEVQVTQQDKVVARVIPARPALQPDLELDRMTLEVRDYLWSHPAEAQPGVPV